LGRGEPIIFLRIEGKGSLLVCRKERSVTMVGPKKKGGNDSLAYRGGKKREQVTPYSREPRGGVLCQAKEKKWSIYRRGERGGTLRKLIPRVEEGEGDSRQFEKRGRS